MSREQRFAAWVVAVTLGISAPVWVLAMGREALPSLVGMGQNIVAVCAIVLLVVTTPPDAIRVSPMVNWLLFAAGLIVGQVAGNARVVMELAVIGALLWLTFPPRTTLSARKLGIPEWQKPMVDALASRRVWSLVLFAWLPPFWAGPDASFSLLDLSNPLGWAAMGYFGAALWLTWIVGRDNEVRWAPVACFIWTLAVVANVLMRVL